MKKLLMVFILFIFCLSNVLLLTSVEIETAQSTAFSTSESENKRKKNLKTNSASKDDKPATPSIEPLKTELNSLGHEVDIKVYVETPPYTIERCDQVVSFETEYIPDQNDYTIRNKAHATITAYHFNIFETKDPNKLLQSILFTNSRVPPVEPQGAENCLLIDGGEVEKSLLVCASNAQEIKNYGTVLSTFDDCRSGKIVAQNSTGSALNRAANGESDSESDFSSILKSCGSEGSDLTPDQLLKKNQKKKLPAVSLNSDEFWIPGGHKVPGSKEEAQ